jgi:hypothetical protein
MDEFARVWHRELVPRIHAFPDVSHVYMGADREKNTVSGVTLFEKLADEATLNQWVQEVVPLMTGIIAGPPQVEYYEVIEEVT